MSVQVLTIGKISAAVVLAGAAYQDEAGYARMTGLPPDKTRLIDDRDGADTQVCWLLQSALRLLHAHSELLNVSDESIV